MQCLNQHFTFVVFVQVKIRVVYTTRCFAVIESSLLPTSAIPCADAVLGLPFIGV